MWWNPSEAVSRNVRTIPARLPSRLVGLFCSPSRPSLVLLPLTLFSTSVRLLRSNHHPHSRLQSNPDSAPYCASRRRGFCALPNHGLYLGSSSPPVSVHRLWDRPYHRRCRYPPQYPQSLFRPICRNLLDCNGCICYGPYHRVLVRDEPAGPC